MTVISVHKGIQGVALSLQYPGASFTHVDAHGVPSKAGVATPSGDRAVSETSSSTHQPRSWSKAEAPLNIAPILVTLSRLHFPSG